MNMEKDVIKFLEQDKIDMSKYLANSEIMKNETKEIYQTTSRLYNEIDISNNATKTIYWMAPIFNRPLGYPLWFMTAYPDVVKWFSDLEKEKIISIIGDLNEDYFDAHECLEMPILREIVDAYKVNEHLECC